MDNTEVAAVVTQFNAFLMSRLYPTRVPTGCSVGLSHSSDDCSLFLLLLERPFPYAG